MKLKLSKSSLHYKLYRLVYGDKKIKLNEPWESYVSNSNMPNSICPYFWKLVLAFLYTLVLGILWLPAYFFQNYRKDYGYSNTENAPRILVGTVIVGIIFTIRGMIMIWIPGMIEQESVVIFGIIGYTILMFALIIIISNYGSDKGWFKRKKVKQKKPNVIKEFIKAKKNKLCPMIEFE